MEMAINGKTISVPRKLRDVRLLDFIRDFAGLKGTKFGCGLGLCGACTVHIDGAAARSCQLSAAAALLSRNPEPTEEDIRAGMSGNLCRCETYTRIRQAVALAAKEAQNAPRR